MFWVKRNSITETLQNRFKVIEHNCSRGNSEYNFKEDVDHLTWTTPLNKYTYKLLKTTNSVSLFKAKIIDGLIKLKKKSIYFQ